jgi:WD40 repeat protein
MRTVCADEIVAEEDCFAHCTPGAILAGGLDKTIHVFAGTAPYTRLATLQGHEKAVVALDFSPDSRALISGSWDKYGCDGRALCLPLMCVHRRR